MNYIQPSQGLNGLIQPAQNRLYNYLCNQWNVGSSTYNAFGLTQRNKISAKPGSGYIPEFYFNGAYRAGTGNSNNGGLMFEDSISCFSFFDEISTEQTGKYDYLTKLRLIFSIRLDKITPGGIMDAQGQRLEELAMNDVVNWIESTKCSNMTVKGYYKDIDKVYEHYSGEFKQDALNKNMQPRYSFRIDLQVVWNPQLYAQQIKTVMEPVEHTIVLLIKTVPDATALIQVGDGRYIQQQYAPGMTLQPKRIGDMSGYLSGRSYIVPFVYNPTNDLQPDYNSATGTWDRAASGGFVDSDVVSIRFLDDYGNWVNSGNQI